ncbi:MAG TPA: LamG domain-containing protein [Solirubrobacterales bacterium]|nr:LamG domain-containing protein [Solirubrobacterales bacterium]
MHFGTDAGKFGGYLAPTSATPMQVTSPLLAPPQLTLLAWIKQSGYPGLLRYIAGRGNDGPTCSGSSYALYTGYSAVAGLHFYVRQPDAAATGVLSDSPPDSAVFDGNWHLVAGTFDGANIHLYVDGVEVGTPKPASGIGYAAPINDPAFYVDGYPPQASCLDQSDFPGLIDEVRVYNRALTATELQRLAAAPGPVPPVLVPDECLPPAKDSDRDGTSDACDEDPTIPDSCTLRVARSRVFVYKTKPKARLVVKYKTRAPAKVTTTYKAKLANGKTLQLGSVKKTFKVEGIFKLPVSLSDEDAGKVRSAKSFSVSFSIPKTPKACARAYSKALTKKAKVAKQTVWFQADAILGGLF